MSGVQAIPTEGLDPLYFGLVGENVLSDQEVISYLNPERDGELEYDIASMIAKLDRVERAPIGILSGLTSISADGGDGRSNFIQTAITDQYDVTWLASELLSIQENLQALLLIAPRDLSAYSVYQLEQFVLRGGRLIILSDPAVLMTGEDGSDQTLYALLSYWGVSGSDAVLVDHALGLQITADSPTGPRVETQPLYIGTNPSEFSKSDLLVSSLQRRINFGAAGWFDVQSAQRHSTSSLITSSEQVGEVESRDILNQDIAPSVIRQKATTIVGPKSIALRLSGLFPDSSFDEPPVADLSDDPVLRRIETAKLVKWEHLQTAEKTGDVLLLSDTDFLSDAFFLHPQTGEQLADNGAFLLNALETFSGAGDFSGLRVRPQTRRPMTRVLDMRQKAEDDYLSEQDRLEAELSSLEAGLSSDQMDETDLQGRYLQARSELRTLQRKFRSDIIALETWLRVLTIWLPFGGAIFAGLIVYWMRKRNA